MIELAIIGLLLVIGFQGFLIVFLINKWDSKEKDLLNRIQARNYETFVQSEVMRETPRPLTPEEIYEQQLERGIPV
jgi:hypothetical protein